MKTWVKKLLEQFDVDWAKNGEKSAGTPDLNDERATLLFVIDTLNKHLFEVDKHSVRKVREALDNFAKGLLHPGEEESDKLLFRFRQFFASYRIDEYTYVQNSFDDFKRIIWDFADQLSEDLKVEKAKDGEVNTSLDGLREAVESNSIDVLRAKSREFINLYIEHQSKKDDRRTKRIQSIRKNLDTVKKQLTEANHSMRNDHLTDVFNRLSFDEQLRNLWRLHELSKHPSCLLMVDIDHFKKVNDSYGHDIGDLVIKECANLLRETFNRPQDFVARIGGEEFAVLLSEDTPEAAQKRADEALNRIRKEALIHENLQIRFTVSMGLASLREGETPEQWYKRADTALYQAKHGGRNRLVISTLTPLAA